MFLLGSGFLGIAQLPPQIATPWLWQILHASISAQLEPNQGRKIDVVLELVDLAQHAGEDGLVVVLALDPATSFVDDGEDGAMGARLHYLIPCASNYRF
jgi:hypothetical protein